MLISECVCLCVYRWTWGIVTALKTKILERYILFTIYLPQIHSFYFIPKPRHKCDCCRYAGWRCCHTQVKVSGVKTVQSILHGLHLRQFKPLEQHITWIRFFFIQINVSTPNNFCLSHLNNKTSLTLIEQCFFHLQSIVCVCLWTNVSLRLPVNHRNYVSVFELSNIKAAAFYHSGWLRFKSFQVFLSLHPPRRFSVCSSALESRPNKVYLSS